METQEFLDKCEAKDIILLLEKQDIRLTDCVIEFSGGGYEGCIHEQNWVYITSNYSLKHIYVSGYRKIEDFESLYDAITDWPQRFYVYKNTQEHIQQFMERRIDLKWIVFVVKWLQENTGKAYLFTCEQCEKSLGGDEVYLGGFVGDGGIGLIANNLYCRECYTWYEKGEAFCVSCGSEVSTYSSFSNSVLDIKERNTLQCLLCGERQRLSSVYMKWKEEIGSEQLTFIPVLSTVDERFLGEVSLLEDGDEVYENFWICECEEGNIHYKEEKECSFCSEEQQDCPNILKENIFRVVNCLSGQQER